MTGPTQYPLFDSGSSLGSWTRVGPARVPDGLREVGSSLPLHLHFGTSSWSFPGWTGLVYDREATESVLASDGLGAYGAHPLLSSVGIDRGYYRPPEQEVFALYRRQLREIGARLRFVVKAHRDLVMPSLPEGTVSPHYLDAEYAERTVIEPAVAGLGDDLGAVLFQFPPIRFADSREVRSFLRSLWEFLVALPRHVPYAVEIRSPQLLGDDYLRLLRSVNAAHSYLSHPSMPPIRVQNQVLPPEEMPFVLVRWMLKRSLTYEQARARYTPFRSLIDPDPKSRSEIAELVSRFGDDPDRNLFVIVGNKAEGSAPLSVRELARTVALRHG